MLLWKLGTIRMLPQLQNWCFNPCSLGCCSESSSISDVYEPKNLFQSLFSWMLLWKASMSWSSGSILGVSILVLLDVALKGEVVIALGTLAEFQSLFSWMLLWKVDRAPGESCEDWCFNPCSLGCCSERPRSPICRHRTPQFQSLFSWMLLWKIEGTPDHPIYIIGFNPCSLGCCSESAAILISGASSSMSFNPCSLGCCSESPGGSRVPPVQEEVSILVLLDVALKAEVLGSVWFNSVHSFNPCSLGCCSESFSIETFGGDVLLFQSLFSWMLLWKTCRKKNRVNYCTVSILVLLDVALKDSDFV